ncbi:MAG: glycosyltransferase family 4 protein [Acidimicrobiales bacterium]|nr:glycosyltransferase family 4 protein [Acidimicrobiales bacterium]
MRVAVYHNLWPGGAMRVLHQQLRWASDDIEYHLYEPSEVKQARKEFGPFADLERTCHRDVDVGPIERPLPVGLPPSVAESVRLARRDTTEASIASLIDQGRYDLVFLHPDHWTFVPGVAKFLESNAVMLLQEPNRQLYEKALQRPRQPLRLVPPSRIRASARESALRLFERRFRRRDQEILTSPRLGLISNSDFSGEAIYRTYARRPTVCRLGVDLDVFVPADSSGAEIEPYVIAVGTVMEHKQHELAVDAVALLPERSRPALRVVAHRGNEVRIDHLRRRASERGVDLHVHLAISDQELARLYSGALATMCVAMMEPFGLTTLESLACGTPIVAVREGGFREVVVEGLNGVLVDPTPASVAEGLRSVVASGVQLDPAGMRTWLRENGWDVQSAVGRLEAELRRVVEA